MAKSIGEYMLMRYFFPGMKDKRKFAAMRHSFMNDMQFNLGNGVVTKAT